MSLGEAKNLPRFETENMNSERNRNCASFWYCKKWMLATQTVGRMQFHFWQCKIKIFNFFFFFNNIQLILGKVVINEIVLNTKCMTKDSEHLRKKQI